VKVQTAFAANAGAPYVTVIPQSTSASGRASWQAGFPPINFVPIASGGVPPYGQDMNGILNAMSAWTKWQSAGGPVSYDAGFASAVGGYPQGAVLTAANGLGWWVSAADNNATNPDSGGAGWLFIPMDQASNGDPNGSIAGVSGATGNPASLVWDYSNGVWWVCTSSGSTSTAKWAPLATLTPVAALTGPSQSYTGANLGQVVRRSNNGSTMTDSLPGSIANGWWMSIFNTDNAGNLRITVPIGKALNGTTNGSLTLLPGQNATITADASGNFWVTTPPIPQVFSGQAIYVNASGTFAPGVYDVDTRGGAITFTLEGGGSQGDNYVIRDIGGALATNNCTINPQTRSADITVLDVPWSEVLLSLEPGLTNWSAT
jgi:hypothetical protein